MSEFKRGQLVAVGGGSDWELRVFQYQDEKGLWCMNPASLGSSPYGKGCVCPAEIIWPHLFLTIDRQIIDALVEERNKLEAQVAWLIRILYADYGECPPRKMAGWMCDERQGCEICWLKASEEAVECRSTQE